MIRYLTLDDQFWRAAAVDGVAVVTHGTIGEPGKSVEVDTYELYETPAEWALDRLAEDLIEAGYEPAPIPDIHLEIEKAFGVMLPAAVRELYATGAYLQHQGKTCARLKCEVDFAADCVLGQYDQVHHDGERGEDRHFIPISSRVVNGADDEQSWIGIDPSEPAGAVYALYTSGDFDVEWEDVAAFLADLKPAA